MADLLVSDAVTEYRRLINAGFNTYKAHRERGGNSGTAPTAATYVLPRSGTLLAVGSADASAAFYLDPAELAVTGRDSKLRVRALCVTNAVAPTTNWTVGLYPVATWGGAAGSAPTLATVGAVVAGSTVLFTAPSAAAPAQGNSGDFAIPVAGYYALCVVNSGAAAANSVLAIGAALQVRQV